MDFDSGMPDVAKLRDGQVVITESRLGHRQLGEITRVGRFWIYEAVVPATP